MAVVYICCCTRVYACARKHTAHAYTKQAAHQILLPVCRARSLAHPSKRARRTPNAPSRLQNGTGASLERAASSQRKERPKFWPNKCPNGPRTSSHRTSQTAVHCFPHCCCSLAVLWHCSVALLLCCSANNNNSHQDDYLGKRAKLIKCDLSAESELGRIGQLAAGVLGSGRVQEHNRRPLGVAACGAGQQTGAQFKSN